MTKKLGHLRSTILSESDFSHQMMSSNLSQATWKKWRGRQDAPPTSPRKHYDTCFCWKTGHLNLSIYIYIYIYYIIYIHIHLPSIFKGRHERFVPLSVGDAWCRCAPLRFAALRFSLEIPRTRLCRSYRPSSSACKNARLGMGNDDWGRWSNRWDGVCAWKNASGLPSTTWLHGIPSILDMRRESGLSIE